MRRIQVRRVTFLLSKLVKGRQRYWSWEAGATFGRLGVRCWNELLRLRASGEERALIPTNLATTGAGLNSSTQVGCLNFFASRSSLLSAPPGRGISSNIQLLADLRHTAN